MKVFEVWACVACFLVPALAQADEDAGFAPKGTTVDHTLLQVSSTADDAGATPCGFLDFFKHHTSGPGIHKWMSYFPVYEEHFSRYCGSDGRPTRMMEIGIQSGGSMLMWQHAFGENLQLLLGVDINPNTTAWEKFGSNVKVEIGSQADTGFLDGLKHKYADGFDIILDDGSHVPSHILTTFARMWSSVRPGGVYMIEDIHGTNPVLHWLLHGHETSGDKWPGIVYPDEGIGEADRIEKGGGDALNHWTGGNVKASKMQDEIESVKVYPFMVAITKREAPLDMMKAGRVGTQWIPY